MNKSINATNNIYISTNIKKDAFQRLYLLQNQKASMKFVLLVLGRGFGKSPP